MRYALSILLALAASIANAADFALPVDASWSGATVTLVASRDGTQLGTGSGTIAQLAGGQYKASATIDLSGAGAGQVTVTVVDASGNMAAVGSGYQIDGAGALLDTTPLNSTETQAAAASALAAYDPPTNAEMEARTIVAANYATAADLTSVLADTAELQGLFTAGGTLRVLFPGSTIAAASDVTVASIDTADADLIAARVVAARGTFYPPRALVWVLQRGSAGLTVRDSHVITKDADETLKMWIDFAGLLGRNEAVQSIDSLTFSGGTATKVASSQGITGNLVYFQGTGGADGDTTTVAFTVTTSESQVISGEVTFTVVD